MKMLQNKLVTFLILLIITFPAFASLLNSHYFSMHDDQHVARLYLLDKGIHQGYLYPRWVDTLSFGFGDPLYNFYPPLVYYIGEIFHLFGFSYITSINLVFALGFFLAALGMYLLAKEFLGKWGGYLAATIYTYFFYHAVNAYVRGALAEFFTMSILPFILYAFYRLTKYLTLKNSILFGISFSLLPLTHQLIALPFLFFMIPIFFFSLFIIKERMQFIKLTILGGAIGIGLSAFFWLPVLLEKKYTFLDQELGGYILHYIDLQQFWYSPWGFGGSVPGPIDGFTFQLGKYPIFLVGSSLIFFVVALFVDKKYKKELSYFPFFFLLLLLSLFMTTGYSSFIWDNIKPLWNLQFPWRFLTISGLFLSLSAAYITSFIQNLFPKKKTVIIPIFVAFASLFIIYKYHSYFKPQHYLTITDNNLTSFEDIAWRESKTVLNFLPRGVKSTKDQYGNYILDISESNLPKLPYTIKSGKAVVTTLQNKFEDKSFRIDAGSPISFQLNTFHFIGWQAWLDGKDIIINDNNLYKLSTVNIPKGNHQLVFKFVNTPIRSFADSISIFSIIILLPLFFSSKKSSDSIILAKKEEK